LPSNERPFYLGVVFWGNEFRDYFTDFCLASLLSENNLPALADIAGSRFLICTTMDDWATIQRHPAFEQLARLIEPVHLPIAPPEPGETKMHAMSRGHKAVAERMFMDRVRGIFVYPDTVFADGALAAVKRHALNGRTVVLAFCPRFANEGFLAELRARAHIRPGEALSLTPRGLTTLAIENMHSETRTYDFSVPYFSLRPVMCFWRVADDSGLVFHTTNWAPVLVDYAALSTHDADSIEKWTIDGDYIYRNFPDAEDIHIVAETDEITLISFTPESSLTYLPLRPEWIQRLPLVGPWFRSMALCSFLHSHEIDSQKRILFPTAVCVRSGDGDLAAWRKTLSRASRIAKFAAAKPLSAWERRAFIGLRILNEGILRHFDYWIQNRRRS